MSKISSLELQAIKDVFLQLSAAIESHNSNQDSIWDVIHGEVNIEVTDDDRPTYRAAINNFKLITERLIIAESKMQAVVEHFSQQ